MTDTKKNQIELLKKKNIILKLETKWMAQTGIRHNELIMI